MTMLDKALAHFEAGRVVPVEVPEWEAVVHVRKLSIAEEWDLDEEKSAARRIAKTVTRCALDEDGKPLFESKLDTWLKLEKQVDPDVLLRITRAARGRSQEAAKNG